MKENLERWLQGTPMSELDGFEAQLREEYVHITDTFGMVMIVANRLMVAHEAASEALFAVTTPEKWSRGYASGEAQARMMVAGTLGHFSNYIHKKIGKA